MLAFEGMKVFNAIPPGVIKDNAAFTAKTIDTAVAGGAQALVFVCSLGAIDAALAVFKVMQSDTETDATTLGGAPDEVVDILTEVVPGAADDDQVVVVIVDLSGPHKRYLQLQATAGDGAAGTYLSAVGFLTNVGVPELDLGALALVRA